MFFFSIITSLSLWNSRNLSSFRGKFVFNFWSVFGGRSGVCRRGGRVVSSAFFVCSGGSGFSRSFFGSFVFA